MRLIDADKLKREDLCDICLSADCGDCFSNKNFEDWIASQPTAYDPDKIVEQLEEQKTNKIEWQDNAKTEVMAHYYNGQVIAFFDAIEIVKGGAV